MKTKSDLVRELVAEENFKKALAIAKDFRLGLTKEQMSSLTRAHECLAHPGFYSQLGMDEAAEIAKGIQVLRSLYGN